jgi:hypothetical protein
METIITNPAFDARMEGLKDQNGPILWKWVGPSTNFCGGSLATRYESVMSPVIDATFARAFAEEWVAAWNSGDLERIFSHYADDFEMRSPLIVERGFSSTGALRGKDAIRPYWGAGIALAKPPLEFELIGAYAGVNTVVIHYRSVGRKYVVEIIEFDEQRRAIRGNACQGADA